MEFISSTTHQKYTDVWNNSHGKPTRNWQKNSCTPKAAREISMSSGRTEKKALGWDLQPGKLCKEEKVCKGRPLTLGSKQVSGIPVLGSCVERQAHLLTGKPTKSDNRAVEAQILFSRLVCALFC